MPNLWYTDDEVGTFHPIVENALTNALNNTGFNAVAEIVHHPTLPHSTIIPDFGIRLINTQRFVLIIEVKRTVRDVNSQRFIEQTRSYVHNAINVWENGFHPYFCVTNVETLILLADRVGPTIGCFLKDNPYFLTPFEPATHDATNSIAHLQEAFESILTLIFQKTPPIWTNNWDLILSQFSQNYQNLTEILQMPLLASKELALFELFRLLAYSYLKDFYIARNNPNRSYFHQLPPNPGNLQQFIDRLTNDFARVRQLDFQQVFENHPNAQIRIFPERINNDSLELLQNQINILNQYNNQAIAENSTPTFIFNLLTSKIYNHQEMQETGKVMSDTELSNLLATLCIDSSDEIILDPCCGDGALLDAAYDRLSALYLVNQVLISHNHLLNQIFGIEKDPFLAQLATFRLISKNLHNVTNQTNANIQIGDMFENMHPAQFDIVLMNPPFLRNENLTIDNKKSMLASINQANLDCFFTNAQQANLYFYFVNFIWHYIRDNGKAGLILMAKFLNNRDGVFLKQFILNKVEAIVSYPRKYFQEFAVTTVIVILRKDNVSENVAFLRVSDENLLSDPEAIKTILSHQQSETLPAYRLLLVPRDQLNSGHNWKDYLRDQKYDELANLDFFVPIGFHCVLRRGGAENSGGSDLIFPKQNENGGFFGLGNRNTNPRATYDFNNLLVDEFIGPAIINNFEQRNFVLTEEDLEIESAFHFPERAFIGNANLVSDDNQGNLDLVNFFEFGIAQFGAAAWRNIVNASHRNKVRPKIIIPRADRNKHVVYYNPLNTEIVFSTNFFLCEELANFRNDLDIEQQCKFITGFLLSSFGQIEFEINSNNQEGLRKLEGFQIQRFRIPNLNALEIVEINNVITAFEELNEANVTFSGSEGINTPRRQLDTEVGRIIFNRNQLDFASIDQLVDFFELFLAELVEDRRI